MYDKEESWTNQEALKLGQTIDIHCVKRQVSLYDRLMKAISPDDDGCDENRATFWRAAVHEASWILSKRFQKGGALPATTSGKCCEKWHDMLTGFATQSNCSSRGVKWHHFVSDILEVFFDIVDIYRQECSSKDSWDHSTSSDMFWFVDCEYGNQNEVPVTHYWRTVHSFEVVRVSTMLTFRGLIAGEGFVSASKAFRQMSHRCSHERWLHFDFMASFQANPT